jgi:hypothetical protein
MYHLVPVIVISDHFKYINMDISKENIIKLIIPYDGRILRWRKLRFVLVTIKWI